MPRHAKPPEPRTQPPMPVTVAEDDDHRPQFVTFEGEELRVDSIDQQWQVDAETWEHKPVSQIHYRVTMEGGKRLEVFKNMDHEGWYHRSPKIAA